jgi:hypothetical protein
MLSSPFLSFQFANRMAGEPVTYYQHKGTSLGFSRGGRGFVAMGALEDVEFDTGMPDGDYCDIIHDCGQYIMVRGGKATLRAYQSNDPVVAFCIGCDSTN